jgi:hypothetical protein
MTIHGPSPEAILAEKDADDDNAAQNQIDVG